MLTPQQLRRLGDIVAQYSPESSIQLRDYVKATLAGEAYRLCDHIRVSPDGKIEATRPQGPKPWPVRLRTRELVRAIVRCSAEGFALGWNTKEWLEQAMRAEDFRAVAEEEFRRARGGSV